MAGAYIKRISRNQVARFVLSAGLGFLVDIVCFYLFYHNIFGQKHYNVLGMKLRNHTVSLGISFFLGVMVNFLMTRYIVFTASRSSFTKQFSRFMAVAFVGFFASQLILQLMIQWGLYAPVARIATALSLFAASFFVHKAFSFSLSLRQQHAATDTSASN